MVVRSLWFLQKRIERRQTRCGLRTALAKKGVDVMVIAAAAATVVVTAVAAAAIVVETAAGVLDRVLDRPHEDGDARDLVLGHLHKGGDLGRLLHGGGMVPARARVGAGAGARGEMAAKKNAVQALKGEAGVQVPRSEAKVRVPRSEAGAGAQAKRKSD